MSRTILKGGIAVLGLILAHAGVVQARTDAETKAIVLKWNTVAFMKPNPTEAAKLTAPEFVDHDGPVDHDGIMKMIKQMASRPARPGGGGGPPPPNLTLAHGDYVLLLTEQNTPNPTAAGKTYIADNFDLFRVNAAGKVAEHWDNFTKSAGPPSGPPGGGLPRVVDDAGADDAAGNLSPTEHKRTDAQTIAIVEKFNADAFTPAGDKQALASEMSEDFYEHHPPSGTPEATKSEFLAHFGPDAPKRSGPPPGAPNGGAGAAPSGGPPAPFLTLPFGDYVLVVAKQPLPDPTAQGKTYDAFGFDLFRVNNRDQVAEHWDNGTKRAPGTGRGGPV